MCIRDSIITIWNIAKKHHAGFEMVKRWYKWNGVEISEDELHQCIECLSLIHICKIDRNDLTSYMNYTGLRRGDSDYEGYISKGDINMNDLIDACLLYTSKL